MDAQTSDEQVTILAIDDEVDAGAGKIILQPPPPFGMSSPAPPSI